MTTGFPAAVVGRSFVQRVLPLLTAMVVLAGCTSSTGSAGPEGGTAAPTATTSGSVEPPVPPPSPTLAPSGTITLYTSVTQGTVDAVIEGYAAAQPAVNVDVFRAPTGELAARIAAELRTGEIGGDILWLTDPLSIQTYSADGLLVEWEPAAAADIDPAYRGETFWGTRFLNMVIVRGADVLPGPTTWTDLADASYKDAVAIPDPGFAGSAFGTLAYFTQQDGVGLDFYRSLKANGTTQVKTPDEVTTGVAEGRFKAGITIDNSARTAIAKGSPVEMVWPSDGAIAMYSPIGVVAATDNASAAESFVEFVLSDPGQIAIAGTGFQPIRAGLGGPEPGGDQVFPDWASAFGHQEQLLADYRAIFGG